jgi:hypothetical protein
VLLLDRKECKVPRDYPRGASACELEQEVDTGEAAQRLVPAPFSDSDVTMEPATGVTPNNYY